jgi:hypothetical protein
MLFVITRRLASEIYIDYVDFSCLKTACSISALVAVVGQIPLRISCIHLSDKIGDCPIAICICDDNTRFKFHYNTTMDSFLNFVHLFKDRPNTLLVPQEIVREAQKVYPNVGLCYLVILAFDDLSLLDIFHSNVFPSSFCNASFELSLENVNVAISKMYAFREKLRSIRGVFKCLIYMPGGEKVEFDPEILRMAVELKNIGIAIKIAMFG